MLLETFHTSIILDVRAPLEYVRGHIPGAHSLPLFSNEERAHLGVVYKKQGKESAIKEGLTALGPRLRLLIESVEKINPHNKPILIYCARGGMRSGSAAWLFKLMGMNVTQLPGGYKAFKSWCRSQWKNPLNYRIIAGKTGSGKTELLHEIEKQGEQIIDLERLACHRGSVFGELECTQPTQEQFENNLAWKIAHCIRERAVYLESESRRIGNCVIPGDLWALLSGSPSVFLELTCDQRSNRLVKEYGKHPIPYLIERVYRLKKRLGLERVREIEEQIVRNDLESACVQLLEYYDALYEYSTSKRSSPPQWTIPCASKSISECARMVLACW